MSPMRITARNFNFDGRAVSALELPHVQSRGAPNNFNFSVRPAVTTAGTNFNLPCRPNFNLHRVQRSPAQSECVFGQTRCGVQTH